MNRRFCIGSQLVSQMSALSAFH